MKSSNYHLLPPPVLLTRSHLFWILCLFSFCRMTGFSYKYRCVSLAYPLGFGPSCPSTVNGNSVLARWKPWWAPGKLSFPYWCTRRQSLSLSSSLSPLFKLSYILLKDCENSSSSTESHKGQQPSFTSPPESVHLAFFLNLTVLTPSKYPMPVVPQFSPVPEGKNIPWHHWLLDPDRAETSHSPDPTSCWA